MLFAWGVLKESVINLEQYTDIPTQPNLLRATFRGICKYALNNKNAQEK